MVLQRYVSFIKELCDERGKTILISSHILSEISLLADDVGIIDHGKLLEEESLEELEAKTRNLSIFLFLMHGRQLKLFLLNSTIKTCRLLMGIIYIFTIQHCQLM